MNILQSGNFYIYYTDLTNKTNLLDLGLFPKLICPEILIQKYKNIRACLHGGGGPQIGEETRLAFT